MEARRLTNWQIRRLGDWRRECDNTRVAFPAVIRRMEGVFQHAVIGNAFCRGGVRAA